MGLPVGTFPRPGRGRCPVLVPPTCGSCVCVGGGGDPPMGVYARCRGYRPPLGAGTKCPVASPPRHESAPGAVRPLALAGVGGGRSGQCGALSHSWWPALPVCCVSGRRGLEPHVQPTPPLLGWGLGGVQGSVPPARGRRGLELHTSGHRHPVGQWRRARGPWAPAQGPRVPT